MIHVHDEPFHCLVPSLEGGTYVIVWQGGTYVRRQYHIHKTLVQSAHVSMTVCSLAEDIHNIMYNLCHLQVWVIRT